MFKVRSFGLLLAPFKSLQRVDDIMAVHLICQLLIFCYGSSYPVPLQQHGRQTYFVSCSTSLFLLALIRARGDIAFSCTAFMPYDGMSLSISFALFPNQASFRLVNVSFLLFEGRIILIVIYINNRDLCIDISQINLVCACLFLPIISMANNNPIDVWLQSEQICILLVSSAAALLVPLVIKFSGLTPYDFPLRYFKRLTAAD